LPREIRCVVFEPHEVRTAVADYQAKLGGLKKFPLDEADLLSALLVFCARSRIPLPRRASKTLVVHEETLVLSLSTDFAPGKPKVSGNRISYDDPKVRTITAWMLDSNGVK
jgi:hypothetical protein